jgi:hypothetical protein
LEMIDNYFWLCCNFLQLNKYLIII